MRTLVAGSAAALVAAAGGWANDLSNPGAVGVPAAVDALFGDPAGNLTISAVTMAAESTSVTCGAAAAPADVQFGAASGFQGVNGIVLSNGHLEDQDTDGAPAGHPSGCAGASGEIGVAGISCTGTDAALSNALTAAFGLAAPLPSSDAAILAVSFENTSAATVDFDLNYAFATFENPSDPGFFDSFAILFDGTLVAGGTSKDGPAPGTDPWILAASPVGEFQGVDPSGFHTVPACETGLRTITLTVPPGAHTLVLHVADGGPDGGCLGAGGTPGSDNIVPSMLFVGPGRYQSGNASGLSGPLPSNPGAAPVIGRVGHPAPDVTNGGTFPADFRLTLANAGMFNPVFLALGFSDAAVTFPIISPLEVLVTAPAFLILPAGVSGSNGQALLPTPAEPINSAIVGLVIHFQWFIIDTSGVPVVGNTKGLKVNFGV